MVLLLVAICLSMVMIVALCSCWRREQQKNEWHGLDGMVTPKNPDENVNHLPSIAEATELDENLRATTITKTRRSLPDIPSENRTEAHNQWTEQSGDNTSDLYATVEHYSNTAAKRHTLPNGIDSRPSISQHSSISQADEAPYARVNYDKVKKENPYARVQNNHAEMDENSSDDTGLLRPSTSQAHDPIAPPRSRRTSANSTNGIEIPAATAVAGGIAANVELPYMTPPISQANFSGDSQDSSKGYTSISVREPLEKIRAQTKQVTKLRDFDPHYSTVSDDSDEMYTTIQDPNNELYMSTSETYAQIMPLPVQNSTEINSNLTQQNPQPSTSSENHVDSSSLPHLPTVDGLKQTHSRQASSSSSVGLLSSPKPEKRQANSPLPPPPSTGSPDSQRSPVIKNLDDMYAKVHKNRKPEADENLVRRKLSMGNGEKVGFFEEENGKKSPDLPEHDYETLKKEKDPDYEKVKGEEPGYASINGPDSLDPGYEELKNASDSNNYPNYETLKHRPDQIDGYSVVNKKKKPTIKTEAEDPNYESMSSDHYAGVKSTDSESDPNYESVKYLDVDEPPYEKLSDEKTDETISKGSRGSNNDLLPYERLGDDGKTDSESSGYENIKYADGYETIKCKKEDPPYDTVNDTRIDGDIFEV
nr:uncharacterized protein LOC111416438 isoform X1 [Onthophagus taurus]